MWVIRETLKPKRESMVCGAGGNPFQDSRGGGLLTRTPHVRPFALAGAMHFLNVIFLRTGRQASLLYTMLAASFRFRIQFNIDSATCKKKAHVEANLPYLHNIGMWQ